MRKSAPVRAGNMLRGAQEMRRRQAKKSTAKRAENTGAEDEKIPRRLKDKSAADSKANPRRGGREICGGAGGKYDAERVGNLLRAKDEIRVSAGG